MARQVDSPVPRSMDMFERAKQLMPAGTQLISRRPSRFAYGITPVYADRAKGSRIWDIDGGEYIDWGCSCGAIILGYADPLSGTAVVSMFHFRQEFYGLPEDESKVYPRVYKELIHQTAYLYSIRGCSNPICVHYETEDMMDIDNKSTRLCDICVRQLQKVYAP